ncbi:hypothetical protein DVH05_006519 [Phytophthora capsici]|nr:hypothetical protein DVH05_006519 [Phytophthora capsici]
MPTIRPWAGKGRKDSARVLGTNKHAGRMRAVLTVQDDGMKLPILFIIKGVHGGRLQGNEMSEYPDGHVYAFPEFMDGCFDVEILCQKTFKV